MIQQHTAWKKASSICTLTMLPSWQGVWSPAGGWYPDPPNWRRNTALALLGTAILGYFVFRESARREERYRPATHFIPSELWSHNVPKREEAE